MRFCNFYKHFIYHFFNFAKLLSKFIKKDQSFEWTFKCQDSFESLKDVLFKTPVLAHFDPNKKIILETDVSQYITDDVLSQCNDNGSLHSVAFYSKNILPIECNYHIYNKKLLIIIKCLKNWRPELEMICDPFEVLTDNQALKHFKTVKKLLNNIIILIWFQTSTFISNITLKEQMLKLTHLLKCQTAFLAMKMKKFKDIIKCFYNQNSFKSLSWKGGKVHNRALSASTISMNKSKKQIKLTES